MKASTKRLLVILGNFGLIFGSFFIYFSLIVPTYQEIQQIRGELESRRILHAEQQEAERVIEELEGEFVQLAIFREALSNNLPINEDIPSVLNQFQGIARLSRISLRSLSFQYLPLPQTEDLLVRPIGVIRVNVSLTGDYSGLKSFVSLLETNIRIMDLTSLRVDGGAGANPNNLIHNLIVDVYYQS